MNNVNLFLDLYKTLEEDLKEYYIGKQLKYSSCVFEYMNGEGKKHYDEIDMCRELRNLLSHHSSLNGRPAIIPSDELIESLKKIIYEVENPITAKTLATPTKSLVTASFDSKISSVLDEMKERGFSHVPVIENGILRGVFSIGAAFSFFREQGTASEKDFRICDVKKYIVPEAHSSEQYLFCTSKTSYEEIKKMFKSAGPEARRVAAVFVTSDGSQSSAVLGMITPWDIIRVHL